MERCKESLRSWVNRRNEQNDPINNHLEIYGWIRMLCSGLKHIHDQDMIHRDIKPDNVLISHDGVIKIADFGTAIIRCYQTHFTRGCGTKLYKAPEQDTSDYDNAVDIHPIGTYSNTLDSDL